MLHIDQVSSIVGSEIVHTTADDRSISYTTGNGLSYRIYNSADKPFSDLDYCEHLVEVSRNGKVIDITRFAAQ